MKKEKSTKKEILKKINIIEPILLVGFCISGYLLIKNMSLFGGVELYDIFLCIMPLIFLISFICVFMYRLYLIKRKYKIMFIIDIFLIIAIAPYFKNSIIKIILAILILGIIYTHKIDKDYQ